MREPQRKLAFEVTTQSSDRTGRQQRMAGSKQLAMEAMAAALKVRREGHVHLWSPVCVYDLAEQMGVEVRFVECSSMEGIYCKGSTPVIMVSSLRPPGRQAYTCGHELGHHVFGHGSRVDELVNLNQRDPKEILADAFAGFLLMPKSAVDRAFAVRNWDLRSCTPLQVYTVAGWLGVGYTTLLYHMAHTLHLISFSRFRELEKTSPSKIRAISLGPGVKENLLIIDEHWSERAIDVHVGDFVQLPAGVLHEGDCVRLHEQKQSGSLFRAVCPGTGRFYHPFTGWAAYVRVSRKNYVGRSIFRHLEDPDDD